MALIWGPARITGSTVYGKKNDMQIFELISMFTYKWH